MAKFLIVLSLATVALAVDYRSGFGGGIGYPIGAIGGHGFGGHHGHNAGGSIGVTKQVSSTVGVGSSSYGGYNKHLGSSFGGLGPAGIGAIGLGNKHIVPRSYVGGLGPYQFGSLGGGHGGFGLSKQISTVGTHHVGFGGISKIGGINSLGYSGLGGLGGIGGYRHLGGFGGIGGFGGMGINRFGYHPSMSTIPGGYYGGVLAYPQAIPQAIAPSALHYPGSAIDSYKGYYAGYFPGSIGYGHSYNFFH